jgi:hypothetical protein
MERPFHFSERNIVVERPRLLAITLGLGRRRLRVISLLTLSSTEKGHLLRDDLHDLMPRAFSILVVAGLNPSLNRYKPTAIDVVRAGFCQTVENDYWKPRDPFPLLAVSLPLLVDCNREAAERNVVLSVAQLRRRTHVTHNRDLIDSTHAD